MLYICRTNIETIKTMKTYKINDTKNGTFATVTLPEGVFNLKLTYKNGLNNVREWSVVGTYPREKYMIAYENGVLIILEKGGDYEVGQKINHKAFGEGVITNVSEKSVIVDFKGQARPFSKSILKNFIK
jgi:hypothetical protein